MTDDLKTHHGRNFARTKDGGWLEVGAVLPEGSTAKIAGEALVMKEAASRMYGGAFRGGEFRGGEFRGGLFRDGLFQGGEFRGGEFNSSPSCAQRSDGHMFVAKTVDGELRIWAGCRNFSWAKAVAHWNDDHRHGAESQRIIHFLKAQEEAKQ